MRSARLAIALLSLTFTYAALGQTGGTITGLISDPAGAVVANAPVEAKNTATGVVLSVCSDVVAYIPRLGFEERHVGANRHGLRGGA